MTDEQPMELIRYDLDMDKVIDSDLITTMKNILELLDNIVGTMLLPDKQSEDGFLASPMSKYYKKKEDVKIQP